jgi:prepilin-type N-terminal cleavage/methylation domain-containing protein
MSKNCRKFSHSHLSAFTLVELIVVIAAIAVLASIFLPLADRASRLARQLRCANNMQQISQAVFAYAADHGGNFPAAPGIGEFGNPSLAYWMSSTNGETQQIDYGHGQLWQYLDPHAESFTANAVTSTARYRIFNCPTDEADLRLDA